jgi:hypothetical protein
LLSATAYCVFDAMSNDAVWQVASRRAFVGKESILNDLFAPLIVSPRKGKLTTTTTASFIDWRMAQSPT